MTNETSNNAVPVAASRRRKETRTADGEGAIYFDKKRKLWIGELMVGWKPDPNDPKKRRRDVRKVSARKQAECRAKLQRLRQEVASGTLPEQSKSDSVAGYLARWLKAKEGTVRGRTHDRYRQIVNTHLVPAFGTTKLSLLRPDALQRVYADKLAAGLSPRTVHHLHTVLHNALEHAVRWGYVPRNVADAVAAPKVPKTELRPPTADEVSRLLEAAAAHGDRWYALWAMAVFTGCRLGELLGLTWQNVDLTAGSIAIRQTLVGVRNRTPSFGEPKTDRSRRVIHLPPDAVAALKAHRDRQRFEAERLGEDYATYGLVFATQVGTPLDKHVVQEAFKRALARAEPPLPQTTRFHDLRHAAATLMLASGEDIPTVAGVLGHSKNSTTLDIYAHALPAKLSAATSAIQRAIRRRSAG